MGKIKIGDFGLAKTLDSTYEMAETKKGARIYMAPERHRGERYNHKADMWSLGCILYELCTLRYTFTNVPDICEGRYQPIPDDLHPGVSAYIPRLLRVDSRRRPSADKILRLDDEVADNQGEYRPEAGVNEISLDGYIYQSSDYYTDGTMSSSY